MKPSDDKTPGKGWRTKVLATVGALSAALISLGYSAYQQRLPDAVPTVEVGAPIDAGRWKVSVLSAGIASELPNGSKLSPDKKAIVVEMTLENISSQSSNLYGDLIKLVDVPDAPKPNFYLLRDNAILWDLQPRMPEKVLAAWEVPADMDEPQSLRLRIQGAFFKPRDNLYAAPGWFPAGDVAEIDLPLVTHQTETGQ